jgi:hypothetical protein
VSLREQISLVNTDLKMLIYKIEREKDLEQLYSLLGKLMVHCGQLIDMKETLKK